MAVDLTKFEWEPEDVVIVEEEGLKGVEWTTGLLREEDR